MNLLSSAIFWVAALCLASGNEDDTTATCEGDSECKPTSGTKMLQKTLKGFSNVLMREEQTTERVSFEESRARARTRVKLFVEKDWSNLHSSVYRAYQPDETCLDNAANAFDHFVQMTVFAEELTPGELAAFQKRFTDELNYDCKHDPNVRDRWIEDIQTAFRQECPIMTEALAASINDAHLAYEVAMQSWMVHESPKTYNERMGKKVTPERNASLAQETARYYSAKTSTSNRPPDSFESSAAWPECAEIFQRPHQQGTCGSCWAFGGLLAADSRICVATDGAFSGPSAQLSRGFVTSCANDRRDGCSGDLARSVFNLLSSTGVPTGGTNGCKPYFGIGEGTDHFQTRGEAPPCPSQCESTYGAPLSSDLFVVPGIRNYREIWPTNRQGDIDAKNSMMEHGPLSFGIYADPIFMGYSRGIHDEECGVSPNHEVVAIGWGPGFIIGMNSWGSRWGDNGGFKVADCKVTDWTIPGAISRDILSRLPWGTSPPPATPAPATPAPATPVPATTAPATPAPATPGPAPLIPGLTTFAPPATLEPEPEPVPTTAPAPLPPPVSFTVSGDCVVDAAGCVTTKNFPNPYDSRDRCTISKSFGKIQVMQFATESGYDYLKVNNRRYQGSRGPQGVTPRTQITWRTDRSVEASGWRICPTEALPTPQPTPAPTPQPTPAPTPAPRYFRVTGPCHVDMDGCVTSPNYPENYGNSQRCTIGKSFGPVRVVDFDTERCCDKLRINNKRYSGKTGPTDRVVPRREIVWTSDGSVTRGGWKICPW